LTLRAKVEARALIVAIFARRGCDATASGGDTVGSRLDAARFGPDGIRIGFDAGFRISGGLLRIKIEFLISARNWRAAGKIING